MNEVKKEPGMQVRGAGPWSRLYCDPARAHGGHRLLRASLSPSVKQQQGCSTSPQ